MTPSLILLFYVFILLFCHFISLAVINHGLCSCEVRFVTFCLLAYFGICYGQHCSLTRIVLISYIVLYILKNIYKKIKKIPVFVWMVF